MLHALVSGSAIALLFALAATRGQDPSAAIPADPLTSVLAMPIARPVANGALVLVLDSEGQPAPDACVVHFAAAAVPFARQEEPFPGDEPRSLAFRAIAGSRHAVDANGQTRVPMRDGHVVAFLGDRIGTSRLLGTDPESAELRITVRRPLSLTALVVDADGRPAAGVPVAAAPSRGSPTQCQALSDAEGRAALRVLDTGSSTAELRLVIPARQPVSAPLPREGTTQQLQLPSCGTLRAELRGQLLPGSQVRWRLFRSDNVAITDVVTDGPRLELRHVEAGLQGVLEALADDCRARAEFGPIAADSSVALQLDLPARDRLVVFRALDENGKPIRDTALTFALGPHLMSARGQMHTNREGWSAVQIVGQLPMPASIRLHRHVADRYSDAVTGAIIELPRDAAGRMELGEVTLDPIPVVLQGRVFDREGKPLAAMQLRAKYDAVARTTTAADGSFQLRMLGPRPDSVILAPPPGYYFAKPTASSVELPTGTFARLELQPAGRMRFGRQGLPDALYQDFSLRLEPVTGAGESIEFHLDLESPALYLPPGHWHCQFRFNKQEVHRFEHVRVEPGIECHDPRFMEFDWRAFATLVTIRVEEPSGKPCDECTVWHHYGNTLSGAGPQHGVHVRLLPLAGGDLRVAHDAKLWPEIRLGIVNSDQHVRFGAGPRVQVACPAAPALPPGAGLVVSVGAVEAVLDPRHEAVLWLPAPGPHPVRLFVCRGNTKVPVAAELPPCEALPGGARLTITIDPQLQAAIDSAARRAGA